MISSYLKVIVKHFTDMDMMRRPPHPAFRYGDIDVNNPNLSTRGRSLINSAIRSTIEEYPLNEMSEINRYDYFDFKKVNETSRHFVDGFDNVMGPGDDMEPHIPEEVMDFLLVLLHDICKELVKPIYEAGLGVDNQKILLDHLDDYRSAILDHANTMLAMFSDKEWIWFPYHYLKLGWKNTEPDYLSRNYWTNQSRLNMVKHLEVELCERNVSDERYNFHFMYAVFVACIPNHHGREIRTNEKIMEKIESFVPEEQIFEKVESTRMELRNKMIERKAAEDQENHNAN